MSYRKVKVSISNTDNIIDSRDVIERLKELEGYEQEALDRAAEIRAEISKVKAKDGEPEADDFDCIESLEADIWTAEGGEEYGTTDDFTEDEYAELQSLKALDSNGRDATSEWVDGTALVHEDHFRQFAEQEAEDLGMVNDTNSWPYRHIDWEAAADELKSDYTTVEFGDSTYYVRSI